MNRRRKPKFWRSPKIWLICAVLLFAGVFIFRAATRTFYAENPGKNLAENLQNLRVRANEKISPANFNLPNSGRAAVGFINPENGEISCRTFGENRENQFPTASIAKVITALVILEKLPLNGGDGANFTFSARDEEILKDVISKNGSFVAISAGETLSEKQILEGILLASGNNLADSLAIFAFGNLENYRAAAKNWLAKNNLTDTKIGADASGYDPETKSTAKNLCEIMLLATKNSDVAKIMQTREINDFPLENTLKNTNRLLGENGVFAGKTGFTDEAGHGAILAAKVKIGDENVVISTAILGQESYDSVFENGAKLLASVPANLTFREIISANEKIGEISTNWGEKSDLIARENLSILAWNDEKISDSDFKISQNSQNSENSENNSAKTSENLQTPISAGEKIGEIKIGGKSVEIFAKNDLQNPDFFYKLSRGI